MSSSSGARARAAVTSSAADSSAAEDAVAGAAEKFTTKEGWRRFVDEPLAPPAVSVSVSLPGTDGGQDGAEAAYRRARMDFHSQTVVVATPVMHRVSTAGRRLLVLNRYQRSARRGLMVTGPGGTGKTTAVTQLGKTHELALRRDPDFDRGRPRIPVMYVTVPFACTPRMLAVEFARFLGLPLPRRANLTDVVEAVCGVLADVGCDLVIVDELNNINLTTRSGSEVSDQLKYFSERLAVTFVYAGIDLAATLFAGSRGQQIASRFTSIHTSPFGYATRTERGQWQALVAGLEQTLRLYRHRAGTLPRLAGYLHDRTAGQIGSLSHLVREAAIEAISSGQERITRAGLDLVALDRTAENHHRATRTARPRTRTPERDGAR
ncbi:MAG: TniB family NTP-binding protein [Pseudonocardia sp.]|nr:TniB family NTP-binding protein [Pseudonocardia sp.]